jgi:hypothetical protein
VTDPTSTVDTVVGPANVLHRLALAVDCVDASTGRRVRTGVAAGREVDRRLLPPGFDRGWPCVPLSSAGLGRSLVRYDHTTPGTTPLRLRLVDPDRRFVARRFDLSLWPLAAVLAAEAVPPTVPAASRMVRPWLWPGSAALLPRGTTVIRGVVHAGPEPVRWARLTALRPTGVAGPNDVVGHGHANERGEFVVIVTDSGTLPPPAPTSMPIDLVVIAPNPATAPEPDPLDRYADLVVEPLAHPSNPPLPAEVDNAVLRGTATPDGYVANTAAVPRLTVPVGGELTLTEPIPFAG